MVAMESLNDVKNYIAVGGNISIWWRHHDLLLKGWRGSNNDTYVQQSTTGKATFFSIHGIDDVFHTALKHTRGICYMRFIFDNLDLPFINNLRSIVQVYGCAARLVGVNSAIFKWTQTTDITSRHCWSYVP